MSGEWRSGRIPVKSTRNPAVEVNWKVFCALEIVASPALSILFIAGWESENQTRS
jgi:hypothetical protein